MVTPVLDELWREQSGWSRTADRLKAGIDRARLSALVIVVVVAVAGTAAGESATGQPVLARVLAAVAAAGAGALPLLRPLWSGTRLRDWTRARSVAEALKTDVYLWLAGAGPYIDDIDAVELRRATDKVRADAADLLRHRAEIEPAQRELPAIHDLPSYFAQRVCSQVNGYYRRRATQIRATLRRVRVLESLLGIAGVILGVAAATLGASFAAWLAVIATVGTALAVHVSAGRYEFQLIEFLRTAERLEQLYRDAIVPGVSQAELRRLAVAAEQVISVENQAWMVKLAEDPPEQGHLPKKL